MWNQHKIISLALTKYLNNVFDCYPKDIIDYINQTYYEIDKVKIRCAGNYTYVILSPNDVYRLGSTDYFNKTPENKPTKINLKNVDELYCGMNHCFAITNNHTSLYCWGANGYGQLGINSNDIRSCYQPIKVEFNEFKVCHIKKIVCARYITFVLLKNGTLFSFGVIDDIFGHIYGDNNSIPKMELLLPLVKDIECSSGVTTSIFAITNDGFVYAWGGNTSKQLCINNKENYVSTPTKMNTIKNAEKIICGAYHTFVLTNKNKGYCFGANDTGKLMYNGTTDIDNPKAFKMGAIRNLYCSDSNTYVITKKGNVLAYGRNYEGQLGIGITYDLPNPYSINPFSTFTRRESITLNKPNKPSIVNIKNATTISCDGGHVFVTTNTGKIFRWGQNNNGQLGLDHYDDQNTPQEYIIANLLKF